MTKTHTYIRTKRKKSWKKHNNTLHGYNVQ